MHNKRWKDSEWSKINSKENVEQLLLNIDNQIKYTHGLFGKSKVSIEDTEWILDDFEKVDLGISKLGVCKLATDSEIVNLKDKRNKLNEKLKELNTRIYCQD